MTFMVSRLCSALVLVGGILTAPAVFAHAHLKHQ